LGTGNGIVLLVVEAARNDGEKFSSDILGPAQLMVGECTLENPAKRATYVYQVPIGAVALRSTSTVHLLSFELPPGDYTFRGCRGNLWLLSQIDAALEHPKGFPSSYLYKHPEAKIALDAFNQPVHAVTTNLRISCVANQIVYAGHLTAHMGPREKHPLTDPAGHLLRPASYPYFDRQTVSDAYEEDMGLFSARFPHLRTASVGRALMAPSAD